MGLTSCCKYAVEIDVTFKTPREIDVLFSDSSILAERYDTFLAKTTQMLPDPPRCSQTSQVPPKATKWPPDTCQIVHFEVSVALIAPPLLPYFLTLHPLSFLFSSQNLPSEPLQFISAQ